MKRLGLTSRSAITSSSLFARQGNMAGTTMALRFYSEELSTNRIFVGRLPWSIDTDRLKSLFETYGEVIHARVIIDRETQRSRGFGFVTFSDPEAAQKAIEAVNETEIEGRTVICNFAKNTRPQQGSMDWNTQQ